jgi:chromatin remodeling complex protein RSC6
MKRRGIEEELKILTTRFESVLSLLTPKQAAPILKQLETLQKRVRPKRSTKGTQSKNQNSGLLKPVAISKEIAEFAGWNPDELHSRVDVTKSICDYIKTKGLQKTSNRKNIIPDDVLKTLLRWDEDMQKTSVTVTSVDFSTDADQITFVIDSPPHSGLQTLNYYNGSDLYTQDNEFVGVLKNIKNVTVEDGSQVEQYIANVEKRQQKIDISSVLVIKVPLTYPKIQARISIHLAETEKQSKKPRVKKTQDAQPKSKKNKKSQDLAEKEAEKEAEKAN